MIKNASPPANAITQHKLFYIIATLFFMISAVYAVYYYKERCLYIDSAFQLFKIITYEGFNFEAFRFGVFFTQILPIIAIKVGLPLKSVLIIFSLSFWFVNYLVFLFSYHILKEKTVSFIIPVSLLIGISHGYFYTVTELYQAIVFIVLFYAWVNTRFNGEKSKKKQMVNLSIAFIIFLQCFFCHPSSIFAILFIIGYHAFQSKQFWKNEILIIIPLILLLAVLKFLLTESSSYEGNLFGNFIKTPTLIFQHQIPYPLTFVFHRILGIYLIPLILFIVLIVHFIYFRKYKLFVFFVISFFVFFVILIMTFYKGEDDIAMEKTFASLFLFILIPISKEVVFSNYDYKIEKSIIYLGIVIAGFVFIQKAGKLYQKRVAYLGVLLNETKSQQCDKFIIQTNELNEIIRIPWALSVETLFYSALETPDKMKSIYGSSVENEFSKIDLSDPNLFLMTTFWLKWDYPLNKKYFKLKTCPYSWIHTVDLTKPLNYEVLKDYDFDNMENTVILSNSVSDSLSIGKKAFILDSKSEFGLTYESKISSITHTKNPVFFVKINALTTEIIENENIFLVLSLHEGDKLIYYKAVDIGKMLRVNSWTSITQGFEIISADRDNLIKIYLWNPKYKKCYIHKMTILINK